MPFTFSHPAAVLPICRGLGRYGVLSALIIGSISPDLAYFIPIGSLRSGSHTLIGLFLNCLPAGLLFYLLFHLFLKGPLLSLIPWSILEKLGSHASFYRSLPTASWYSVTLSVLLGATTHLVWDSFTHSNSIVIQVFPTLEQQLFSIGEYRVYLYKILQHGSTLIGLVLLSWWFWQWYMHVPRKTVHFPVRFSSQKRYVLLFVILAVPIIAGIWVAAKNVEANSMVLYLQSFAGRAIFTALPTLALLLVTYSLWWHVGEN